MSIHLIKKGKSPLKIGIFDSGLGGLSILKELFKSHNHYHYIYLADTKNFPYGNQNKNIILENAHKGIHFLEQQGVDIVIIACHTVSAIAYPKLQSIFSFPIFSIIPTSIKHTILSTKTNIVGVMATSSTITSLAYHQLLKKKNPHIKLFSKPFSSLANIIEKNSVDTFVLRGMIENYFDEFFFEDMDTVILGCTHFAILKSLIHNILGSSVHLIDPASTVAEELESLYNLQFNSSVHPSFSEKLDIYVTRFCRNFEKKSQSFLESQQKKISIKEISLVKNQSYLFSMR